MWPGNERPVRGFERSPRLFQSMGWLSEYAYSTVLSWLCTSLPTLVTLQFTIDLVTKVTMLALNFHILNVGNFKLVGSGDLMRLSNIRAR